MLIYKLNLIFMYEIIIFISITSTKELVTIQSSTLNFKFV